MLPLLDPLQSALSKAGSGLEIARFSVIFEQNERGGYLKVEISVIFEEGLRPQNSKIQKSMKSEQKKAAFSLAKRAIFP